jgi:glycosyltransferase involved in cell wall biosynthesis
MHVLSVSIPYPRPGRRHGGLFVQRRLSALSRRVDLAVVNPQPWFPMVRPVESSSADDAGHAEVPPVTRPRMFYLPGLFKGLDSFWLRRVLLAEIHHRRRDRPIDLIDAQFEYPEGVGAVQAARALGLPVFITLRGLLTKYLKSPARRSQCLAAMRAATGIISVAHALKRTAESHGIDGTTIRVIPNAVDARTFAPGPRDEARAALGIDPVGPLIVTVGYLQPVKGQHDLIPALAGVQARRGPVRLALLGDDRHDHSYTRTIRRQIAEGGLGTAVSLLGPQPPDHVARWLRAADLFVLPSYHEGCCNAVLEALACGTPVVTTPVGDNGDYVTEDRGRITPVGDVDALAAAIIAALDRAWDRPAIAAAVASRTWDHVAEETLDFFHERLAARAPLAVP